MFAMYVDDLWIIIRNVPISVMIELGLQFIVLSPCAEDS